MSYGVYFICLCMFSDLFVGQLKSSLTCTECGYCSTVFDPFWDLSLPIAKVSSDQQLSYTHAITVIWNITAVEYGV